MSGSQLSSSNRTDQFLRVIVSLQHSESIIVKLPDFLKAQACNCTASLPLHLSVKGSHKVSPDSRGGEKTPTLDRRSGIFIVQKSMRGCVVSIFDNLPHNSKTVSTLGETGPFCIFSSMNYISF